MGKPILCLDFDGVIHDYKEGWLDGVIYGAVTPGFFEWATVAKQYFTLVVYSSRSKTPDGVSSMFCWLKNQWGVWIATSPELDGCDPVIYLDFEFAHEKPPAMLTIDDRAITFEGTWAGLDPATLLNFKTWSQK